MSGLGPSPVAVNGRHTADRDLLAPLRGLRVPHRPASPRRLRDRRLLAYLLPTLLALVAVQTWFVPGTVIAVGDMPPPFTPGTDYRSHWNQFTSGEGTPSYEITSLPYFEGLRAANAVGVGEEAFQRLWLSLLFAGVAPAVAFLAFGFTRSTVAAGVAGVLATFNAYRLITSMDAVTLAATIVAAVLGGLVVRAALTSRSKQPVAAFALASLALGFVFSNPPHVALVAGWVVAVWVAVTAFRGRKAAAAAGRFLAKAVPLVLLVNLWWIVPAWLTIVEPTFGERFAAVDTDSWSWTHRRASLLNALTLNTSWAWTHPEYFPYAGSLDRPLFALLRLFLPALAVAGVVLARRNERRLALAFAGLGLTLVWLAKGLHAPLPGVNAWLYAHVPGYWLFRDPGKMLLLLVLVLALLAGVGVARIVARAGALAGRALAVFLVGGAVLYAYPLLTGSVVPHDRPLLPPAHVRPPDAWKEAAAYLNAERTPGKVLVLPRGDFYQLPTTWGYYGVPFSRLAIRRGVLEPLSSGYFRAAGGVADLVAELERDLLAGRGAAVQPKLRALGVSHLLLRRDLDRDFPPGRDIADHRALARALAETPGVERVRSLGLLTVYRVLGSPHEVAALSPTLYAGPGERVAEAVGALPPRSALIRARDAKPSEMFFRDQLEVHRLEQPGRWRLAIRVRGGYTVLRVSALVRSSSQADTSARAIRLNGLVPPFLIGAGHKWRAVAGAGAEWRTVDVLGPSHGSIATVWTRERVVPIDLAASLPAGDCHRYDGRSVGEVGIRGAIVEQEGVRALQLSAGDHSACVALPIEPFEAGVRYRLSFAYRGLQGFPPRACLWQEGPDRCAPLPPLLDSPGWHDFTATLAPDAGTVGLQLFLYADGDGRGTTVNQFRAPRVARVRREALLGLSRDVRLPVLDYVRRSPSEFRVRVTGATDPYVLTLAEAYAPGWRLEIDGRRVAAHLRVNGFANGWLVSEPGTYEADISYAPERTARLARRVSMLAIVAVLLVALVRTRAGTAALAALQGRSRRWLRW